MSFKIEGRMKSSFYVATVVKAYRQAIDRYLEKGDDYKFDPRLLADLEKASHREFSTGFYFKNPGQVYESSAYIRSYDIVGMVKGYDKDTKTATIEQRNRVYRGETVEIFSPHGETFAITLDRIWDENNEDLEAAPPSADDLLYKLRQGVEAFRHAY
jgi:putative protease